MPLTYYHILGCLPDATADDIKRAYRRLSKRYHPDLNPGDTMAAKRFIEMKAAYDTLSNPSLRAAYDERLRQPPSEPSPSNTQTFTKRRRYSRRYRFSLGPGLGVPLAFAIFRILGSTQSNDFKPSTITYHTSPANASQIFPEPNQQSTALQTTIFPSAKTIYSNERITLSGKLEYKFFESPVNDKKPEGAFLLQLHSAINFTDKTSKDKSQQVKTIHLILNATQQNQWLPFIGKDITVSLSPGRAVNRNHYTQVIGEHPTVD